MAKFLSLLLISVAATEPRFLQGPRGYWRSKDVGVKQQRQREWKRIIGGASGVEDIHRGPKPRASGVEDIHREIPCTSEDKKECEEDKCYKKRGAERKLCPPGSTDCSCISKCRKKPDVHEVPCGEGAKKIWYSSPYVKKKRCFEICIAADEFDETKSKFISKDECESTCLVKEKEKEGEEEGEGGEEEGEGGPQLEYEYKEDRGGWGDDINPGPSYHKPGGWEDILYGIREYGIPRPDKGGAKGE